MYSPSQDVSAWLSNISSNYNNHSNNNNNSSCSSNNNNNHNNDSNNVNTLNVARDLVNRYRGKEEELIRTLCVELGPEYGAISPRMRRMVYRWYYRLNDEEIKQCTCARFGNVDNLLDYHPNYFMAALAEKFGPELTPTRYNFPTIHYGVEQRTLFAHVLRFPVNKPDGHFRDNALAARRTRIPLQVTPNERPLKPLDYRRHHHNSISNSNSNNNNNNNNNSNNSYSRNTSPPTSKVSEIDILLEKYQPEFHQIIPSIADAMEMLVNRNEVLASSGTFVPFNGPAEEINNNVNNTEDENDLENGFVNYGTMSFAAFRSSNPSFSYTTILTRLANYTYISPSSLLAAVIYLDRLVLKCPCLLINRINVEKLLVTTVRIASKVVDLRSVNNKNFANVFSLSTHELNKMEERLLKIMWFDYFLSPEEFNLYRSLLEPQLITNTSSLTLGMTNNIYSSVADNNNNSNNNNIINSSNSVMNALNNNYTTINNNDNSHTISNETTESTTQQSENEINTEVQAIHSQEEKCRKSKSNSTSNAYNSATATATANNNNNSSSNSGSSANRRNTKGSNINNETYNDNSSNNNNNNRSSSSRTSTSTSRVKSVKKDLSVGKREKFTLSSHSAHRQSSETRKSTTSSSNEESKIKSINNINQNNPNNTNNNCNNSMSNNSNSNNNSTVTYVNAEEPSC